MKKRNILSALILLIFIGLFFSCTPEEPIDDENVIQINNVGLREGVFARRYQLTSDYGQNQTITPEILKNYIKENLEPDYLFIADAYVLGIHEQTFTGQRIKDYKVNLLANNHPLNFEKLTISKEKLQEFYQKKLYKYNLELAQANSYNMADSVYKFLKSGKKVQYPKIEQVNQQFPKFFKINDITFGETLHPELSLTLIDMEQGQVCKPVFVAPNWTIMRLNKKRKNIKLLPIDEMKKDLLKQAQAIFKFEKQKMLIEELNKKYSVVTNDKYYPQLIAAYTTVGSKGLIRKDKFSETDLKEVFLKINNEKISLSDFILSFNNALQYISSSLITQEDISAFINNYVTQNLLYYDAIEKGADQDAFLKDKMVNKENKTLLNKYLNQEIAHKVVVSDADARKHFNKNKDKWDADYQNVAKEVIFELKNERMLERKKELTNSLRRKYNVRYNEPLLKKLAEQLTAAKKNNPGVSANP